MARNSLSLRTQTMTSCSQLVLFAALLALWGGFIVTRGPSFEHSKLVETLCQVIDAGPLLVRYSVLIIYDTTRRHFGRLVVLPMDLEVLPNSVSLSGLS